MSVLGSRLKYTVYGPVETSLYAYSSQGIFGNFQQTHTNWSVIQKYLFENINKANAEYVCLYVCFIGREYTIPSPLQRFLAETVDFFILFCVKATIVLWIMHLSGMK